jgi:hypothetical protein
MESMPMLQRLASADEKRKEQRKNREDGSPLVSASLAMLQ